MDANKILFRCSSLGYIMTEPRSKKDGSLGDTCLGHLADKYISVMYGRETDIQNKYIEKGLAVEEDSITLFSRVKKEFFRKNEELVSNEYICGTPDLFTGDSIMKAQTIIDIKSSWDIFTFYRAKLKEQNKMYWWQLQGYMALTGAKSARLVYCLVNTPEGIIYDEKNKLKWKMGVINPETDTNYQEACDAIDKLSRYDDIPMADRMHEVVITRDDEAIEKLYQRVKDCREYMNKNLFKVKPKPEPVYHNDDDDFNEGLDGEAERRVFGDHD